MLSSLPEPDANALALSQQLVDVIRAEVEARGGWLDFERFMELALYSPGLGYYSGGSVKLGHEGDFVTAPEISALFGEVIAQQFSSLLASFDHPVILELGAGSGKLAETILASLDAGGFAIPDYRILETSADLRERQQSRLASFEDRVSWLDELPQEAFEGVVLANEVLDAIPVTRFSRSDGHINALGVGIADGHFVWKMQPAEAELNAAVESLEASLGKQFADGYASEISRQIPAWIASLSDVIDRGALWLVDYGLVQREYYHPSRRDGTLICHYRHRAHEDPFFHPGLQDISAWVDFSACASAAEEAGLEVAGFTTQGQFLIESGAAEMLQRDDGVVDLARAQALKTLVLPGEMGERFKVLVLTRGIEYSLPGRDLRDRL